MKIYTPAFLFLLLSFSSFNTIAQEQIGLRLDNYSGVNSLAINPASNLNSFFAWDVNLVAAGFFAETNYGYFRNTTLPSLLKNTDQVYLATDFENEAEIGGDMLIFDFYDDNRKKHGLIDAFVSGPGFMVNLNGKHSFGAFTNFRVMVSTQKAPNQLNYYHFDRTPYGEEISIPPFDFAAMSWAELGVNYAYATETTSGKLGLGISLKKLNGYEALYFKNQSTSTITQIDRDSTLISQADIEFGFTSSNADGNYNGLQKNGDGWAFDLGATFIIDETEDGYRWRLGASLLDIGRINFKSNAEAHQFKIEQATTLNIRDYDQLDNVDDYIEMFSQQTLGDSSTSLQQGGFAVWLPAALSLQADYSLSSRFYVGSTLIQRIPLGKGANIVERSNLLAINPRFETRWLGISFPFLLYNWQDFRLGTSIRLGFLTIGTDNLGSILRKSDFSGTDFYIALKVNPFKIGGGRLGAGGKKARGKNVKCYEF